MTKRCAKSVLVLILAGFLFAPTLAQAEKTHAKKPRAEKTHAEKAPADIAQLSAGMPRDVAGFIARRVQCNRWDVIEAHHKAPQREIDAAQVKLKCDALEWEEKVLCRKHARDKLVLRRIALASEHS